MSGRVHIVGAGLAGLACAVKLAADGRQVTLHEAAGQAGGRCRSFHDDVLERKIDNGNHLLFSGNASAMEYLAMIGAGDSLSGPERAAFPFLDLETGERWTVRPGSALFPLWLFDAGRRVPGSRPSEYLAALRLARANGEATVASCLKSERPLYRRFWEPLAVAALNTSAEDGAAALLWPVIRETFGRGERGCRPRMARHGLSDSFVEPALRFLNERGARLRFNCRLRAVEFEDGRLTALDCTDGRVALGPTDAAVLALPPNNVATLVPGIATPQGSRPIVNVHYRLPRSFGEWTMIGLIGGTAQWLFVRGDVASVTVSAALGLVDEATDVITARIWPEVARALEIDATPQPPGCALKEKRATFAQTPDQVARRPGTRTDWANLFLAGDWTDTGLPATIEGAVRSGFAAARAIA